jgi:hypothetical protein
MIVGIKIARQVWLERRSRLMTSSSNTTKADRQDKVVLLAKDLREE